MKTISIGRDENCDIVITDRTNVVSRRHAVITIDNSGKMTITDHSSNGTYINGIKMSENVAVPITRKDAISFAHVFELDWNMVPNVRSRNIKIILGSAVAIVTAVILLILLGHDKVEPVKPVQHETEQVVDTMPKTQPQVVETPEKQQEETEKQDAPKISAEKDDKPANVKKENDSSVPEKQENDVETSETDVDVAVDPIIF